MSHLYPISQAVSETGRKERGHGAPLLDGRCVKELGGHFSKNSYSMQLAGP